MQNISLGVLLSLAEHPFINKHGVVTKCYSKEFKYKKITVTINLSHHNGLWAYAAQINSPTAGIACPITRRDFMYTTVTEAIQAFYVRVCNFPYTEPCRAQLLKDIVEWIPIVLRNPEQLMTNLS